MKYYLILVAVLLSVGDFTHGSKKFSRAMWDSRQRGFMDGILGHLTRDPSPKNDRSLWNSPDRQSRFLSLLTVVNFPADSCPGSSGNNGTCLASQDCVSRRGAPDGSCANGFGVCCLFILGCGSTTAENGTYFVNDGYPSRYDGTGSCQLTIMKSHPDVCQYRLDFDQFQITGPETINHICNNDQFIVSGGSPVPTICGINQGNHMYIDSGVNINNPVTLTFVTSGPSFQRNWKVKVSQIPCSTIYRAEEACLQYYTGVSGQIRSFNYDNVGGLQLSNQDYSMCVRVERNFCGIQYTSCADTSAAGEGSFFEGQTSNNRSRSFTLSGNSNLAVPAMVGSSNTPNSCPADWLLVPCASNVGRPPTAVPSCTDRICGGALAAEVSLQSSPIFSTVKPFRMSYHTDGVEAPNDSGNRGFCINYVQQPCTNNLS